MSQRNQKERMCSLVACGLKQAYYALVAEADAACGAMRGDAPRRGWQPSISRTSPGGDQIGYVGIESNPGH